MLGRPSSRHLQGSTAGSAVNAAQRERSCRSASDEASTHALTAREVVLGGFLEVPSGGAYIHCGQVSSCGL